MQRYFSAPGNTCGIITVENCPKKERRKITNKPYLWRNPPEARKLGHDAFPSKMFLYFMYKPSMTTAQAVSYSTSFLRLG
jgi:hypothetical protein